jgi:hypothetical protein
LITDGAQVRDGSPPRGYDFPQQPAGTFRFFERITPDARATQAVRFDLPGLAATIPARGHRPGDTDRRPEEMARLHAETVPTIETVKNLGGLPLFGNADGDIMYDDLTRPSMSGPSPGWGFRSGRWSAITTRLQGRW